ncbi:MAG: DUF72 domain-containing protein [Pseudomonadota bacterium]
MSANVRIGTSGWHYEHWQGVFYPDGLPHAEWLAWYARHFDTVEINRSFYRLPSLKAVQAWHDATPQNFLFAVKGSRFITHMKKLKEPEAGIAVFLPVLEPLAAKRGPVLFQLPPRWKCNPERLAGFLAAWPAAIPCAFEFRDPSWHCREIYALLESHNAAFCIFDIGGFCSPPQLTTDFSYIRLHGPDGPYAGCYSRAALEGWAERIRSWRTLRQVYVYFDNDQAGYAVENALALKDLLR